MRKIKITFEISPENFLTLKALIKKYTENYTKELWLKNLFMEMLINLSSEDLETLAKKEGVTK